MNKEIEIKRPYFSWIIYASPLVYLFFASESTLIFRITILILMACIFFLNSKKLILGENIRIEYFIKTDRIFNFNDLKKIHFTRGMRTNGSIKLFFKSGYKTEYEFSNYDQVENLIRFLTVKKIKFSMTENSPNLEYIKNKVDKELNQ